MLAGPAGLATVGDVGRARADADAAGLWPNPALRLERQSGPILDQSKGSQDFVAVEFPLALSGRLGLTRDAAGRRVDAAVIEARQTRARLAREAIEVFVDVVGGERRTRALDEERARLAPVVEAARRRADAGETATAVALRLELELARVDDEVAAARTAVASSRRRAEALVNGPVPAFADVLPTAKSVASSVSGPAPVLALQKRAEAAGLEEEAAGRRIIPDVVVGGGPSLLNTGSPEFSVGYLVTVGVELPLFDRGQGDAARARAERTALDAERSALSQRLDGARAEAAERARGAQERSAAFGVAVERAAGLFDAAARDLTVGSGDVVAFVDTASTLREARLQLVGLQEASARADADLSFFNGALESSPEPAR
ncbi:MAG: TolC family protein [Deltaproteobacteria bacterium]|nr:TolC family protein [Deltaproteobacteria bacterium]